MLSHLCFLLAVAFSPSPTGSTSSPNPPPRNLQAPQSSLCSEIFSLWILTFTLTFPHCLEPMVPSSPSGSAQSPASSFHLLQWLVKFSKTTTLASRDVPVAGKIATYGGKDIVWTPYGPEWRMLRKVCVLKMLSKTTLDFVYQLHRNEIRKTVGYLYSRVGSPMDIGEQMFLTILNVITSMMWGGTLIRSLRR